MVCSDFNGQSLQAQRLALRWTYFNDRPASCPGDGSPHANEALALLASWLGKQTLPIISSDPVSQNGSLSTLDGFVIGKQVLFSNQTKT